MFTSKLANRLFFIISSIVLLAILISIIVYILIFRQYANNIVDINTSYTLNIVNKLIDDLQEQAISTSKSLSNDNEIINSLYIYDKEKLQFLVEGLSKKIKVDILEILSSEGVVVACSMSGGEKNCKGEIGNPLFLSKIYRKAYIDKSGLSAGMEPYGQEKIIISSYKKVYSKSGDNLGMVRVGFEINNNLLKNISKTTTADIFILRDRVIIAGSRMEILTPKVVSRLVRPVTPQVASIQDNAKVFKFRYSNLQYSIKISRIYDINKNIVGHFLIATKVNEIYSRMKKGLMTIIASTIFILIIIFIISYIFSQLITNPVKALVKGVRKVSAGDLNIKVEIRGEDEIGELASSFNKMTDDLQSRDRALKDSMEELKKNQQHLIQSGKLAAVGEMAAGLAHEIGNPLSVISGYAQMLSKATTNISETEGKILKSIVQEIDYIEKIIRDLLNFSRPSEEKVEDINVNNVVEESINLISMHSSLAKVMIKKELGSNLPAIKSNHKELQQVFVNIILNAAQSMPDGGILKVITKLEPLTKDRIIIYFMDTGVGINKENIEKIFNPFFTTKPYGVGTGLGLSVSYRIVQKYGGKIEVESEIKKGSTFKIILPIIVNDNNLIQ